MAALDQAIHLAMSIARPDAFVAFPFSFVLCMRKYAIHLSGYLRNHPSFLKET